jgi:hypothetical protein
MCVLGSRDVCVCVCVCVCVYGSRRDEAKVPVSRHQSCACVQVIVLVLWVDEGDEWVVWAVERNTSACI